MTTVLVTGTDTDVGKTIFIMGLVAYWQHYRPTTTVGLMKLLACGPADPDTYRQVLGGDLAITCPLAFEAPLAPPLAALAAGESGVDLGRIWQGYQALTQLKEQVFVEGVGGLGCPLTWDYTVGDLTRDWRVPVILVAPVRLGVIGQLVTHCAYARALGVRVLGIVLSSVEPVTAAQAADWAPIELIENLCRVRVWGIMPHIMTLDRVHLVAAIASLDLEYLLAN